MNVMQTDMINSEVHVLEEVLAHLNVRLFLLSAHLFHQLGSLAHFPVRERSSPYHNHRVVPDLLELIIIIFVLLILLFSWPQACSVVHSEGWSLRWRVFVRFTGITVRVAGVSRWNGRSGDDSTLLDQLHSSSHEWGEPASPPRSHPVRLLVQSFPPGLL